MTKECNLLPRESIDFISSAHFTLTRTLLMNLPPKAALKTPALQTLRAALERQRLAPAFGVRASLAPLFIRRSFKAGFRGSRRDIFRGILTLRERAGVREKLSHQISLLHH